MEGHKQTEIGIFPNDWNVGRIDDFFEIQQGKQVSKSNRVGENQKPFLRTSNIYWGKVVFEELDYMNFSKGEEAKYRLKKNDLLVCEGGDIGRTAIWNQEVENCYYQNHLHRLRAKTDDIDPLFILQWLEYSFVYGKIYFGRGNVTTIPNLSKSRLSELILPHPPLPEQHKIALVLTTVKKAIEQQDNLIRTTTELKKALMQKLFTEGTRGEKQKETEIGMVPESWDVVKIENLIMKTKIRDPGKEPEKEFIYVDVSSVSNELFRIENTSRILGKEAPSRARKIIQDGDVIFATVRPTLKRIAKISQDYHNQICSTGYCVIKPDLDKLIQEYLYQYLQTDFFIEKIGKLQRGASYPAVRDTDVKGMYIPLPKLSEQKEIGSTLNILDQRNNILMSKRQTLTALFKTLLHELMTGQRRVHEMDFEALESHTSP